MSGAGLRTLLISQKDLTADQYTQWQDKYAESQVSSCSVAGTGWYELRHSKDVSVAVHLSAKCVVGLLCKKLELVTHVSWETELLPGHALS